MKIWITGSSGSGKTTLANKIGNILDIPVTHRDRITWKENWVMREKSEQTKLIREFSSKENWIFDGDKFTASKEDGRYDNCDILIHLEVNRFICFYRTLLRFIKHKKKTRPDLADGCKEDLDYKHLKYILLDYPSAQKWRNTFFEEMKNSRTNILIMNDKKIIKSWLKGLG